MAESFPTVFAHNLTSTTDPGSTDDHSKGYRSGSIWVNKTGKKVWICTDGTVDVAVWLAASSALGSQINTAALADATITKDFITGKADVTFVNTANAPGKLTTRTAAQMFTDIVGGTAGESYNLRVCNGGNLPLTLLGGTGVTLYGPIAIPGHSYRDYVATYDTSTAMTFRPVGKGEYFRDLDWVPSPL